MSPVPAHCPRTEVPGLRVFGSLGLKGCSRLPSLMLPAQTSGNGMLEFSAFKVFWDKLKKWTVYNPLGDSRSLEQKGVLKGQGAAG